MTWASDLFDTAHSPLSGTPLAVIDLTQGGGEAAPIRVGVDRAGALPVCEHDEFDALVTVKAAAPQPWVSVPSGRLDGALRGIVANVGSAPIAASVLARVLRIGERLPVAEALAVESLAYSTLLGGDEFRRWLSARGPSALAARAAPAVRYERHGDEVELVLASPGNRNAMTATMRDALCEALVNVLDDPTRPALTLRGEGRCFSTGGDLAEFGTATDLAAAHVIRSERSAAHLLHRLGDRATAHLHGACIGSGLEIGAAAARRTGSSDFLAQLPELRMGLIPGAGGTVTLPRAIGRHRTLWLALGAFRLGTATALEWGLLHSLGR